MTPLPLLSERRNAVLGFAVAIVVVGVARFGLSLSGAPRSIANLFSMTIVMLVGTVYFASVCTNWKERAVAGFALTVPYTIVACAALGYTVLTGNPTIFHDEHSLSNVMDMTAGSHLVSMAVGGFSTEPLILALLMVPIGWIAHKLRPAKTAKDSV